jgi:hypothetical protein
VGETVKQTSTNSTYRAGAMRGVGDVRRRQLRTSVGVEHAVSRVVVAVRGRSRSRHNLLLVLREFKRVLECVVEVVLWAVVAVHKPVHGLVAHVVPLALS